MKSSRFKADAFGVLRFPVMQCELLGVLSRADENRLSDVVRKYLSDPYVREAIYLASSSLYTKVVAWEAGESAFKGIEKSIARYLLRMAYRATPFGTFSAVSSFEVRGRASTILLASRSELRRYVQLDCSALARLANRCLEDVEVRASLRFAPNDTLFFDGDALVFTAYDRNRRGRRIYRRVAIDRDQFVDGAIRAAVHGATVEEIVQFLMREFPGAADRIEVESFVWDLVDSQLLCCDHLVDLTDQNCFSGLLDALPSGTQQYRSVLELSSLLGSLSQTEPLSPPGAYAELSQRLADLGVRPDRGLATRVDLYSPDDADQLLSCDVVVELERAVARLVSMKRKTTGLAAFAKRFAERYGDAEVPLAIIADQLEALGFSDRDSSLPALSRAVRVGAAATELVPTLVDRVLALALARVDECYIDITTLVDDTADAVTLPGNEPATLVAWFSLWSRNNGDERPVVELRSVGCQDPGRVMGRFAHGLPSIAAYLRSAALGGSLPVAEIVHQPEDRVGNVTSRPRLGEYEIRIRCGNPRGATRLPLDDLTVSLVGERVVIRSRMLGSAIDLRMSNAHAYDRRENLPLYRFLNFASNQDYVADLFSIRQRVRKASFIPGFMYRGMIVSRPAWTLENREVAELRTLERDSRRRALQSLCQERGMPEWVAVVQGDHVIPLCLNTDWMVDGLLKETLKRGSVVLTDVFPDQMQPGIHSACGAHFHEFQLALRTPKGSSLQRSTHAPVASAYNGVLAPFWSCWASFILRTPPHLQNDLLQELAPTLASMRGLGLIDGFFFVRYRDERGAHLRLRLFDPRGRAMEQALSSLRPVLELATQRRILHTASAEPYVREINRYGGEARTSICERIFFVDSALMLDALRELDVSGIQVWRDAASAIDSMLLALGVGGLRSRLAFARRASADFDREQRFSSEERKRIGQIYATSRGLPVAEDHIPERTGIPSAGVFAAGTEQLRSLWDAFLAVPEPVGHEQIYSVQWSLIHMRMNRLFDRDARLQEAIVWELLKRSYAEATSRAERLGDP